MARFLFVVPPVGERVRPLVLVARELAARGHEVAWTGHGDVLDGMLPPGARVLPSGGGPDEVLAATAARLVPGLRGPAGSMVLWDDFLLPLAHTMVPGVRRAVEAFGPRVLVVDQQALAGAAVARAAGLRRAIETVLVAPDLRRGAERVRDSFAAAGGAVVAVDRLERLVDAPIPAW